MDAVGRWSPVGFGIRIMVLVATAVAWTAISLQTVLLHPSYWEPVSLVDWLAVFGYSAAWLLTAASLLVFREVTRGDVLLRRTIVVVAGACAITGIANALEDGFDVGGMGSVYVVGILSACLGMLVLAALSWGGTNRRLWFVPAFGGLAAFTMVLGGGPLALVAWLGFAAILARARRTAPTGA